MIHYVNTTVSPADLHAAADDAHMTVPQFEAAAIANAVEAYKQRKEREKQDDIGVVPGGD